MKQDFVAFIKLHQDEIFVDEDKLFYESLCGKRVTFATHEFKLVIGQPTYFSVCSGI